MAYDVHVESTRLIEHGAPDLEARLSRRTRHVPLAVDRDGDVAATMILRRGVSGAPMLDLHVFQFVAGHWQLLGGGGGGFDEALQPRPRRADLRAPGVSSGWGGSARRGPDGTRYQERVSYARLHLAQEVAQLRVDDRRLTVARHGFAVVVWAQLPPTVVAEDVAGHDLGGERMDDYCWRIPHVWRRPPWTSSATDGHEEDPGGS